MTTYEATHAAAIGEILEVLRDGARIDRWIGRGADGSLYTTQRDESCEQWGPIPVAAGLSEEEEEEWAAAIHEEASEAR